MWDTLSRNYKILRLDKKQIDSVEDTESRFIVLQSLFSATMKDEYVKNKVFNQSENSAAKLNQLRTGLDKTLLTRIDALLKSNKDETKAWA